MRADLPLFFGPSMPPPPLSPQFYAGYPSCRNPPNLYWLGTGTKYAGLHTFEAWILITFLNYAEFASVDLPNFEQPFVQPRAKMNSVYCCDNVKWWNKDYCQTSTVCQKMMCCFNRMEHWHIVHATLLLTCASMCRCHAKYVAVPNNSQYEICVTCELLKLTLQLTLTLTLKP